MVQNPLKKYLYKQNKEKIMSHLLCKTTGMQVKSIVQGWVTDPTYYLDAKAESVFQNLIQLSSGQFCVADP